MVLKRREDGKLLRGPDGKLASDDNCCCGKCVERCQLGLLDLTIPTLELCGTAMGGVYALPLASSTVEGACRTCIYGAEVAAGSTVFVSLEIKYCSDTGVTRVSILIYPEGNEGCHYKWVEEFSCVDWCEQVSGGTITVADAIGGTVGDVTLHLEGECCCQASNCNCCLPHKHEAGDCIGICAYPGGEGPDFRLDLTIPGRLAFTALPIDADHFIAGETCHSITCGDNGFSIGEWIDTVANPHAIGATWNTVFPLCGVFITGEGEVRNWTIYFAARCKFNDYTEGTLELKFLFQTDSVCFYGVEGDGNYTVWHSEGFSVGLDKCWGADGAVDITFDVPMDPIVDPGNCEECPGGLVATIRLYTV